MNTNTSPRGFTGCCKLTSIKQQIEEHILLPCNDRPALEEEHDFISQLSNNGYIVSRNGKLGLIDEKNNICIPCEMDDILFVPYLSEPVFFIKDSKLGWFWHCSHHQDFYHYYQIPMYDEVLFMSEQEWRSMEDDEDEYFEARLGDDVDEIILWTNK